MGTDKALLAVEGIPLIGRVANCARLVTDEILVCANDPDAYSFLGIPVIQDRFPGCGPLAGLHSALLSTCRERILLLACDLPNLTGRFLGRLASEAGNFDAVIPRSSDGRLHPLCALYGRACLETVEAHLSRGQNRILDLFAGPILRARLLDVAEMGFQNSVLKNVNTPEDL